MATRIHENVARIREKIDAASRASGRAADAVTLVGVTKFRTSEEVLEAFHTGVKEFGENRVQEFLTKWETFPPEHGRWHIIGPLQTNKVKYLREKKMMIQSLDRHSLALEIEKRLEDPEVLVQVNISGEPQKSGVDPSEAERFLDSVSGLKIHIRGLMCIAEDTDLTVVRKQFERMRELYERVRSFGIPNYEGRYLSMGMSNDYEVAILEGSNMVRIGSEMFGRRL